MKIYFENIIIMLIYYILNIWLILGGLVDLVDGILELIPSFYCTADGLENVARGTQAAATAVLSTNTCYLSGSSLAVQRTTN